MFHVINADGELQSPVEGLFRVVLKPCNHVIAELLSSWEAELLCEAVNDANHGRRRHAEIVSYVPTSARAAGGAR